MTPAQRLLERKLCRLELHSGDSMSETVAAYFRRIPSGTRKSPKWTPECYPSGSEKELYAEMACVLLADPAAMVRVLLETLDSPSSAELTNASLQGQWRLFRISTARPAARNRYRGPRLFPGGAGYGGIADIGLFLNPTFDPSAIPCLQADKMLYFELKSSDGPPHDRHQLGSHLQSLEKETAIGVGYLGAIGGRPLSLDHSRWLGHASLDVLLARMAKVATALVGGGRLALEIQDLRRRRGRRGVLRDPNKPVQPTAERRG